MNKENLLVLHNQLSFPLYAVAKEVTRLYKPFLEKYNLTYTQFLVMVVLWESKQLNVKKLGEFIYLDSGTLTPLLRKLEKKGFLVRQRSQDDERNVLLSITPEGEELRKQISHVPQTILSGIDMKEEEMLTLYNLLYKLLDSLEKRRAEIQAKK